MIIEINYHLELNLVRIAIWLIPLTCFICWLIYSKFYKGNKLPKPRGNILIASKRLNTFNRRDCKFLFNLQIPTKNKSTAQLNMVMISPKGIYIFEIKNHEGRIFGNENEEYWAEAKHPTPASLAYKNVNDTVPNPRGNKYFSQKKIKRENETLFNNPITEGRNHVKYLRILFDKWHTENKASTEDMRTLSYHTMIPGETPIISIIAFPDKAPLKDITTICDRNNIINFSQLAATIKDIERKTSDKLSKTDIQKLYNNWIQYTQTSWGHWKEGTKEQKYNRSQWTKKHPTKSPWE